jgi:hypothetical protein
MQNATVPGIDLGHEEVIRLTNEHVKNDKEYGEGVGFERIRRI